MSPVLLPAAVQLSTSVLYIEKPQVLSFDAPKHINLPCFGKENLISHG